METQNLGSLPEFMDSLREVDSLLTAAPNQTLHEGLPSDHRLQRELGNAITRACMVMLVAHFEGFIKAALTELIDEICAAKPPARRIPDPLLELMTRGRIDEILGTSGEERINRTRKLFTSYAQLWDDDRTVAPHLLSAKILTRQFTNARPEVLGEVFGLIGVDDAISRIDEAVNLAIKQRGDEATTIRVAVKLGEIVDRRNKIAHGDRSETPTPPEIQNYKIFLKDVADAIALIVSQRINYCCSLR
ncbi:MAE_28990/MAE_18760 family HEPN-like nuclease [Nonomuraea sp. B10E15]|uniref:MAE_28990/MAE_18760 family HEPN-like nuclease n=1 Tax=Nonomuraea sp. B10E15 TaxID=3153560 RepID=UPI00325DDC05